MPAISIGVWGCRASGWGRRGTWTRWFIRAGGTGPWVCCSWDREPRNTGDRDRSRSAWGRRRNTLDAWDRGAWDARDRGAWDARDRGARDRGARDRGGRALSSDAI